MNEKDIDKQLNRENIVSLFSLGLSFIASIIALVSLFYASYQVEIARSEYENSIRSLKVQRRELDIAEQQYLTAIEQLSLYRKEILLTENSTKALAQQVDLSRRQLEMQEEQLKSTSMALKREQQALLEQNNFQQQQLNLQREQLEREKFYSVVMGSDMEYALQTPLKHGNEILISLHNNSKYSAGYDVRVIAEGLGVYFADQQYPQKMVYSIDMDSNTIVVPAGEVYKKKFVIIHSTEPSSTGSLAIYVNNKLITRKNYYYEAQSRAYIIKK